MADTTEMPVETKPVNPHVATTCTAGPIGLTAFGITTILLNFLNAELIGKDTITLIICYGMFHGGMIQILAGMWEVYRGNIFGGSPGLGGPGAIAQGGGGLVQGHPHVPGFLCSGGGADRTHPVQLLTLLAGLARWHCSLIFMVAPVMGGLTSNWQIDKVHNFGASSVA
eukprot:CAMPEP_0204310402 /NCGR_PEP_ID=MMETSP0469-20131031/1696_1 /ASSEMBLY_ACC=CAM_ASM_000384 /TAXON_ID=2969 /ORGANISM="Oxyrrhis marina" /LENGTH=168 /DNA_ID=CAMNT_0051290173 /DNA_START=44 /DNA_END=550 /DNA_ORIENTATION=+